MIIFLIKATIITSILLIFYKIILEKESFFTANRFYLLGSLLLVFILPFVTLPEFINQQGIVSSFIEKHEIHPDNSIATISKTPIESAPKQEDLSINESPSTKSKVSKIENNTANSNTDDLRSTQEKKGIKYWLLLIYYFGVIVFLFRLISQLGNIFYKIIKTKDKVHDIGHTLVNSIKFKEPCSFFKYIFINPEAYEFDTYEQIIKHETIHVKQFHTIDILLSEVAIALFWFNPMIWFFRKEIEKNIEYQTDSLLIKDETTEKESYQLNLLRIGTDNAPLTLTTNYNQSLLKQRIHKMNTKKSNPHSSWKYAFLIPLLFTMVLFLNKPMVSNAMNTIIPNLPITEQKAIGSPTDLNTSTTNKVENSEKEKQEIESQNSIVNSTNHSPTPHTTSESNTFDNSTDGKSTCEKLQKATKKGDVEKVRDLLKIVDPSCFPSAEAKDYENFDFIKCLISEHTNIYINPVTSSIIIKDKVVNVFENDVQPNNYKGRRDFDICTALDNEEIADAIMNEDSNKYKELIKNLDIDKLPASVATEHREHLRYTKYLLENNAGFAINSVSIAIELDALMNPETKKKRKKQEKDFGSNSNDCKGLIDAITNKDISRVKELLKSVDPNCIDPESNLRRNFHGQKTQEPASPMVFAVKHGRLNIIQLLLDAGASVKSNGKEQESPIMAAATSGKLELVKLMIDNGADFNNKSDRYGTALHCAAELGHHQIVTFLIDKGAKVDISTEVRGTALTHAATNGHMKTAEILLANGADINAYTGSQGSPLSNAIRRGNTEMVAFLLDKGAEVNFPNSGRQSALHSAVLNGKKKEKIVNLNLLLDKGADVNASNYGRGYALIAAAQNGHDDIVKLLLNRGANINVIDTKEGTALNIAAKNEKYSTVEILLKRGANVNTMDSEQNTALIKAVTNNHFKMAKLLLEKGADPNLGPSYKKRAVEQARKSGNQEMINLFKNYEKEN